MPALLKLTFEVREPARVLGHGGEALYGLVLRILASGNRLYAHRIHQSKEPPPFSVSNIRGQKHRDHEYIVLEAGRPYSFVIGFIEDQVGALFLRSLQRSENWPLGGVPLAFQEVQVIRQADYLILAQQEPGNRRILRFHFLTPTSFRHENWNMPVPLPQWVFGSLWHRWHRYAPLSLGDPPDFSLLRIRRYQLETRAVHFYRYLVVGAVGEIEYEIPEVLLGHREPILALTAFAPYAGVGYQTARGLGRVKTRMF